MADHITEVLLMAVAVILFCVSVTAMSKQIAEERNLTSALAYSQQHHDTSTLIWGETDYQIMP